MSPFPQLLLEPYLGSSPDFYFFLASRIYVGEFIFLNVSFYIYKTIIIYIIIILDKVVITIEFANYQFSTDHKDYRRHI